MKLDQLNFFAVRRKNRLGFVDGDGEAARRYPPSFQNKYLKGFASLKSQWNVKREREGSL